jgi:hypothetical protein
MFSAVRVINDPRFPVRPPPPEIAHIYGAIAMHPNSRWRRLVADFYEYGDQAPAGCDIADMNLTCSEGLPHCQGRERMLSTLKEWTHEVHEQTVACWGEFASNPDYFENSSNKYRMMVLKTVLSCRYKVWSIASYRGFRPDSRDCRFIFLDGPLTGLGGNCSGLAVLIVAIGRRLGYPLWFVKTRDHGFARWEARDGERSNIESTSPGLASYTDEHYRTWGAPLTDSDIRHYRKLVNLTPREELAAFLSERARCLCDNLCFDEAEEAIFHATRLAPLHRDIIGHWCMVSVMRRMIRLAEERGNRDGPLSPAVEHVQYPSPASWWEEWALPDAREAFAQIRRHYFPESKPSAA